MQNKIDNQNTAIPSQLSGARVGIKICGMKYPDNILEVAALKPDYMGFIFWEKSARNFKGVIPSIPSSIKKTGVFVNESIEIIIQKIKQHNLQAIQLHGIETVNFCKELKQELNYLKSDQRPIEIIKVFSILDNFNFDELKPFELVCNYFLFDTKGKLPGGNGTTFDWTVLKNYPSQKPFFLSGGIGIDEVEDVKKILKTNLPICTIDLNSKLEIKPGLKNIELCKKMLEQFSIS